MSSKLPTVYSSTLEKSEGDHERIILNVNSSGDFQIAINLTGKGSLNQIVTNRPLAVPLVQKIGEEGKQMQPIVVRLGQQDVPKEASNTTGAAQAAVAAAVAAAAADAVAAGQRKTLARPMGSPEQKKDGRPAKRPKKAGEEGDEEDEDDEGDDEGDNEDDLMGLPVAGLDGAPVPQAVAVSGPGTGKQRERTYKCMFCFKIFKDSSELTKHIRIHTGDKPFQCTSCDKSFPSSSALRRHAKTHTGEKKHECSICFKSFGRLSEVKVHQRIHTGEKPYPCPECGKAFRFLGNMTRHQRGHSNARSHKCPNCGKAFNRSDHLTYHMFMHTGERPFKCNQCPQGFKAQSELTKHQAMHNVMTFQVFPTPQLATIATATAMPVTTTATVVMPSQGMSAGGAQAASALPSGSANSLLAGATAGAGSAAASLSAPGGAASTTAQQLFQSRFGGMPGMGTGMVPMMAKQGVGAAGVAQPFQAGFPRVLPGGTAYSFGMNNMNPMMAAASRMMPGQATMPRVGQGMPTNPAMVMQAAAAQAAARLAQQQQSLARPPTFAPAAAPSAPQT